MTKNKPTLKEEIQVLRQEIESSANNQELLEEALSVLETQLQDQGWIKLFGGGKELSKSALNTLYDLGRAYWLKNPLIRRAVEIQALYVFAQGMTIQADHEPVDVVIQRFLKDRKNYNSISSHQAWMQNERDLALSGNLFFALFTTPETGRVIVRTIPFYEIAEIVCNPDDFKEPWFYRREFMITTFDDTTGNTSERTEIQYYPDWKYDPDEKPDQIGSYKVNWDSPVYHVKTNCLPDMKYGVSELYSAIDWSQAYKRFLENWGKLTEAYTRFAWGITTKGGQAKVSAAKARMEKLFAKTDPNTDEDLEGTVRTKQLPVGGVFTSTEGVTLNAIRTQGATTSMEDARRLMLMVASASGIPEQILTGDPSTGNLATAKAMERPLELQFRNRQTFWVDTWWDLCQSVIDQAIEAGELPGIKEEDPYTGEITYYLLATPDADDETQKQITRDVTITFPPLLEHDVLQTVQAIISAATIANKTLAGTMDRKTMAGLLLRARKVENVEGILDTLPEEPQYDRVTALPTPDTGGYGGFGGIDYTEESLNNLLKDTIKDVQNAARKLQEADDEEGQWVTINGTHVLIKDGETTEQAFKRTTGKDLDQGRKPVDDGSKKGIRTMKPTNPKSDPVDLPNAIFHGSANPEISLSDYRNKPGESQTAAGRGIYFTSNPDVAEGYASRSSKKDYEGYGKTGVVHTVSLNPDTAVVLDLDKPVTETDINKFTFGWTDWYDEEDKTERAEGILKSAIMKSKDPEFVHREIGKPGTLGAAIETIRLDLLDKDLMAVEDPSEEFTSNVE